MEEKKPFFTPIRVLVLTYWAGWGFAALDRILVSVLFPYIATDFNLDFTLMGTVMSAMTFGSIIFYFVGGGVSDKYGRTKVIMPAIAVFSVFSFLTGIARNFIQLIIIRFWVGGAEGAYIIPAITQVSEESPPAEKGLNVGIIQMAMPLFSMFVAPLYGTQIASRFGWHTAFYLTIIPGLVVLLIVSRQIRNRKRQEMVLPPKPPKDEYPWKELFRNRDYITLVCVSVLWMIWLWTWLSFGTVYFTTVRQVSPEFAGVMLTSLGVGGTLGSVLLPALSDHWGRKPALLLGMGLAFIGSAFVLLLPNTYVPIWILLAISAFGGWGTAPIFMGTMTTEIVPPEGGGKAYGSITGFGELVGACGGPIVVGILSDAYGLNFGMWFAPIGALLAGICCLMVRETAPRVLARRAEKHAE